MWFSFWTNNFFLNTGLGKYFITKTDKNITFLGTHCQTNSLNFEKLWYTIAFTVYNDSNFETKGRKTNYLFILMMKFRTNNKQ